MYTFSEPYKLQGPENFDQWKQAFTIMFQALRIVQFIVDPNVENTLSDADQAILLMLLRDSCSSGPQAAIAWKTAPAEAYKLFVQQYSHSPELLQDSLSRQYQALSFEGYEGSLADFNATFNNVVARLTLSRHHIDPIDKINQYLKSLEGVFPSWAERQRSTLRTMRAVGATVTALNLEFLMADILEEQRNPASTTSKKMVHRAKRSFQKPSKDPKRQNRGFKDTESSKRFESSRRSSYNGQGRRKYDKGSNHHAVPEGSETESETELETEPEPKLESFACVIGEFDLDDSKSNCSSNSSGPDNAEDSEIEGGYLVAFNKSKSKQRSKIP